MRPLAPTWTSFAASSSRCTRWMRTSPSRPPRHSGLVVLGDLVALRQVGIEVVLAVEDRARRELAAERQPDHQPEVDRLARWRPAARRAGRGRPGRCACSAARRSDSSQPQNIFVARRELDVDLQADDGLVASAHRARRRSRRSRSPARARRPRRACRFSLNAGPASWKPTGRPSRQPARDRDRRDAGERHRHGAVVVEVHRERVVGLRAELERDASGAVGVTTKSKRSKAAREVLGDLRAHLLRAAVVGVVVAAGQRVGAEHDAALDLGAEAVVARLACTSSSRSSASTRRP